MRAFQTRISDSQFKQRFSTSTSNSNIHSFINRGFSSDLGGKFCFNLQLKIAALCALIQKGPISTYQQTRFIIKKEKQKRINDRKCEVMQLPEGCDAMNQRKVVGHGRISAFSKSILQMSFFERGKGRRI
ncbi:hypothetical protein T01_10296 [Trichinella spiralis]|uniref:Uncharacterized protein n=1 Tax=Trichinella spiralis TaxID=6334 RepID=A0A0V1BAW4_TRISP|nr:hypothetical protein T01_10296 [Trichinella spiralis]